MRRARPFSGAPRVFMMDLWATVPYYTAYLSRALIDAGASVQVASMTYYLDRSCFQQRGLRPDPGLLDIVGRLRLPRALRRVLKLAEGFANLAASQARFLFRRPDIIHVQFLPLLGTRFALDIHFVDFWRRRGVPTVLTVHDLLPHDTGNTHHQLYARLYARMDALICHSAHIKARLEAEFRVPGDKIAVIPHGPFFYDIPAGDAEDTLASLGVAPGQTAVLWQGIVLPYKGVDLLLQAWQQVEAGAEDVCLVVLGTGDPALLASLDMQARALGLKNVRFHPRFCSSEQLVAAYRAAKVVVYPYRAITTSGALATGLSLGKAIVASRLPVFEELLTDGVNALLVDPLDGGALAQSILRLVRDDHLRHHLEAEVEGMQFSQRVWEGIARDTLQLYDRVRRLPSAPA